MNAQYRINKHNKKAYHRVCTDPQKLDRKNLTFGVQFSIDSAFFIASLS